MDVLIYKPRKTAMQSARGKAGQWVLEYEYEANRMPEPLMGWTSSDSTLGQVRLNFDSCEDAVAFAVKKGWSYAVRPEQERRVRPRNYGDNFKYAPPAEKA